MAEHPQINTPKYSTVVRLEETTDGSYCYVAYHPELPDCVSQGTTAEEAEVNLVEATQLTIVHLLSNHLPVPEPMPLLQSSPAPFQVTSSYAAASPGCRSDVHSGAPVGADEVMTAPSYRMSQLQSAT